MFRLLIPLNQFWSFVKDRRSFSRSRTLSHFFQTATCILGKSVSNWFCLCVFHSPNIFFAIRWIKIRTGWFVIIIMYGLQPIFFDRLFTFLSESISYIFHIFPSSDYFLELLSPLWQIIFRLCYCYAMDLLYNYSTKCFSMFLYMKNIFSMIYYLNSDI